MVAWPIPLLLLVSIVQEGLPWLVLSHDVPPVCGGTAVSLLLPVELTSDHLPIRKLQSDHQDPVLINRRVQFPWFYFPSYTRRIWRRGVVGLDVSTCELSPSIIRALSMTTAPSGPL